MADSPWPLLPPVQRDSSDRRALGPDPKNEVSSPVFPGTSQKPVDPTNPFGKDYSKEPAVKPFDLSITEDAPGTGTNAVQEPAFVQRDLDVNLGYGDESLTPELKQRLSKEPSANSQLLGKFRDPGKRIVKELTPEQWNALSAEQKQGVIANFALYQASLEDQQYRNQPNETGAEDYQAASEAIFGEAGGSHHYAPATIKVLKELGYAPKEGTSDLDLFVSGKALASYEDILGQTPQTGGARMEVFNDLSNASIWSDPELKARLEKGNDLLAALSGSGSAIGQYSGADTFAGIQDADKQELDKMLSGLANRSFYERLKVEPDLNQAVQAELAAAKEKYGEQVVGRYFADNVATYDNTTDFMTAEEFQQAWLK